MPGKDKDYSPLFYCHFFGLSFFVWKQLEFGIEALKTEPYARNGDIPLLFFSFGFFELMFENKRLYNYFLERGMR